MMSFTGPANGKNPFEILWIIMNILVIISNSLLRDCKFEMQSELYDFSGLMSKDWILTHLPDSTLVNVSLSVCNTTHQSRCGEVNFCVVDKEGSQWSSLRSMHDRRHMMTNGDIKISTSLNKMNSSDSVVLNVEIILRCSAQDGKPKFEFKDKEDIHLLWETAAACRIPVKKAYEECNISSSVLGEVNVQSLRHMLHYTTTSNGSKYYLNVCGGTVRSVCGSKANEDCGSEAIAACATIGNQTNILGCASKQHIVTESLHLEYRKKKKNGVKIELICNSKLQHGYLRFKEQIHASYIFELETPLACVKKLQDCSTHDKDNFRYNLSSLSDKDYEVYDKEKRKFIISVCSSVKNPSCPEGASVCLESKNSFSNLGSLLEGPNMNEQLSISSSGGAYCNVSSNRYSSEILFKCAKTDSDPVFVEELPNCAFRFEWKTNAACPFLHEEGKDCRVRDSVSGDDFDLKSLRKSNEDYVIKETDGDVFHLNVCGELIKSCNGSRNVGVCLTDRKGEEHAIGGIATSPQYYEGRVSFELHGKTCSSNHMPSRVVIIFICSHQADKKKDGPVFFEKHENCSYLFIWHTAIVCGNFTIYDCQVSGDNGEIYDLSPLSLYDSDYIVWKNSTEMDRKFHINLCQPVMFGHGSRCPPKTGICMQDMSEPNYYKSFTDLGEASGLQYDKIQKVLKVEYINGKFCPNMDASNFHSVILFKCDKETFHPTLIQESGCRYEFEWRTELACSKTIESSDDGHVCSIYNSHSGVRMDFSSLAGQEYIVQNSAGVFRFTICGSLKNLTHPGFGICQETKNGCENMGIGNSHLQYNAGKLYLNYTDGVNCDTGAKKYTIIEFKCDTKNNDMKLVTSQNSCIYTVTWFTSLACVVPCTTEGPKKINLSVLSNNENNYKISVNGEDFFINVCIPLVPKQGLNCHHGAAVCKAVPELENKWSGEVSLGFPHYRPILMNNNVIVNYSSNFKCPNNSPQNLTSSIIFTCDPLARIGVPVLNDLSSVCHYEFLWKTSVVCDDYMIQLTDDPSTMILNNSQNKMYFDLRPLCKEDKYKVENYFIRMCDPSLFCEVEKIEKDKNISYGKAVSALFSYTENKTKLLISSGDDCEALSSEKYHASINLLCAANAVEHLYIVKESDCSVEFVWRTSAACGHMASLSADVATTMTSKSSVSTLGVVFGVILAVIACLLVYCYKKNANTNCCRRNLHRVFNRRNNTDLYTLRNPDSYDFDASSEELL